MKYMLVLIDYDETKTTKEQDEQFTNAVKALHAAASVAGRADLYWLSTASKSMYERMRIELERSKV